MRKTLFALGLLMAGMLASENATAQGCPGSPPIGTIYLCNFVNGVKVVTLPSGPVTSNSSGGAQVQVVGYNTNPCQVIFEVVGFNSQGTGEFGAIDTDLVPGAAAPTTLTAQDPASGTLFPADLNLNLNLKASGSALGGQTYYSNGDLSLTASGINDLPADGLPTVDVNQGDKAVEFISADGDVGFVLNQVSVTLNP